MASNVTPIDLAYPDVPGGDVLELRIALGASRVRIGPGASIRWAEGSYEDPTGLLPLHVTRDGGRARLSQAPSVRSMPAATRPPSLDLRLGAARPFQLVLDGGASETVADLGGVPLTRLTIRHGAGKMDVDFSSANPTEMTVLEIAAGGVAMDLRNLANANFAEMVVSGGAAQYRLDFGGHLQREGDVRLNTGVASVAIRLPAATAARVRSESVLGSLDVGNGFVTREGAYWNEAAAAGRSPALSLTVNSVLGAVALRST